MDMILDRHLLIIETLALKQFNHVNNDNNKVLDLIFSINECRILDDFAPLVKKDSNQPPINFIFDMRVQSIPDLGVNYAARKEFNFRKANFSSIYEMILNADWSTVMKVADDPDEAC
ncbi:hypothetical protein HHI36_005311 [Cryptolaemus montrouzieri]|uniref:Uncharacterized protein n=1 Tax=Cryptolaemus montrouzieri TaxID=559131 RepID=A0ABD2NU86_9CUCU